MFDRFDLPYLPDWKFCKVKGKAPYEKGWERKPYPRAVIQNAIDQGECTGYGLLTGIDGLLAVDVDGKRALERLIELAGEIPLTVSWTSGKPNRMQLLFRLTREQAVKLFFQPNQGRYFESWGTIGSDDYEQLDFRFNGFQSVLPPSPHPETGKPYEWVVAPYSTDETGGLVPNPIMDAPDWLIQNIELIISGGGHKATDPKKEFNVGKSFVIDEDGTIVPLNTWNGDLVKTLENDILPRLSVDEIYAGLDLEPVGEELRCVCPFHPGADNPSSFCVNPFTKLWHCKGCDEGGGPVQFLYQQKGGKGSPRSRDFVAIVRELGQMAGVDIAVAQTRKSQLQQFDAGVSQAENNSVDLEKLPPLVWRYRKVKAAIGNLIALNTLTREIEFKGKPVGFERLRMTLALEYNLEIPRGDFQDIVTHIAEDNAYNPAVHYLESCHKRHTDASAIDRLASIYLGVTDPLFDKYLRKTLIAAVARAFQPGSKVDTALILQGNQGQNKSSFFKVLASPEWFDDSMGDVQNKDELLKLHSCWIAEWAELETLFGKRQTSQIKAFLSTSVDNVRPPYARQSQKLPRGSIVVGTTNETELLHDSSGNRRFWVVPVKVRRIDLALLRQERDRIWGAAVAAYKSGEQWWLTDEEQSASTELNKFFESQHPWQSRVEELLEFRPWVTTSELLNQIKPDIGTQNKGDQMGIAECLRRLGWEPIRKMLGGKQVRVWVPTSPVDNTSLDSRQLQTTLGDEVDYSAKSSPEKDTKLLDNLDSKDGQNHQTLITGDGGGLCSSTPSSFSSFSSNLATFSSLGCLEETKATTGKDSDARQTLDTPGKVACLADLDGLSNGKKPRTSSGIGSASKPEIIDYGVDF